MTTITEAIYDDGVFKPTKNVHFQKQEKFCLIAVPQKEWKKQFSQLLKTIKSRVKKFSSSEVEKDITLAFDEARKTHK